MPHYFSTQLTTQPANTHSNGSNHTHTNNLIGFSIISFPLVLFISIITHKKYRAAVFRRQIATLEKIWLMEAKNNTYRQE